jgi:hypothetical protein
MRLNEKNAESLALENMNAADESEMMTALAEHRSYHEMKDSPILEVDSLTQLKTNLEVLADLTSRLTFLNREIRYMMKVD